MFVAILILLIAVAYFIYHFYFQEDAIIERKLNKIEAVELEQFKDYKMGKIIGTVEFVDEPLIAPLSKRPCALYYLHIEEKVSSSKTSYWKTIIEERVATKYLIKDGDYYAYINTDMLRAYIYQDKKYSSGFLKDATEELEELLKNHGHESTGLLGFNKTMQYLEGVLEENEEVAVYGKGVWRNATELELPEKYGKVLEINSTDSLSVYLSDHPRTTMHKAKKEFEHLKLYKYRMNNP